MSQPLPAIISPCIRLCALDPVSGLCEGCGRSGAEIARWSAMSEVERRAIMADLDQRLAALEAARGTIKER